MASQAVRYARNHARHSRNILVRLDRHLATRRTWTFYRHAPGRRSGTVHHGFAASGR